MYIGLGYFVKTGTPEKIGISVGSIGFGVGAGIGLSVGFGTPERIGCDVGVETGLSVGLGTPDRTGTSVGLVGRFGCFEGDSTGTEVIEDILLSLIHI